MKKYKTIPNYIELNTPVLILPLKLNDVALMVLDGRLPKVTM